MNFRAFSRLVVSKFELAVVWFLGGVSAWVAPLSAVGSAMS